MHDQIFSTVLDKTARFSFDEKVVSVFPDMIRRSVPAYGQMLAMISVLAQQKLKEKGEPIRVVDLGCSLGAVGLGICGRLAKEDVQITGVDLSEPMLAQATGIFAKEFPEHDVELIHADIIDYEIPPCDMVVLNLTLQFLPLEVRDQLIQKIYDALNPQGLVVLSEKFKAEDSVHNDWLISQHEAFKRANGYTELEVSQKRNSIENYLLRETLATHHQRFDKAGFSQSQTWLQYLNFASMVAVK